MSGNFWNIFTGANKDVVLGNKVNFSFSEKDFLTWYHMQLRNDLDFMINDMLDRVVKLQVKEVFSSLSQENNFFSGFEQLGFNYFTKEKENKEIFKRYNLKSFLFEFFLTSEVEFVVDFEKGLVRQKNTLDKEESILVLRSEGQNYYELLKSAYYMYYGLLCTLKRQASDNKLVFKTSFFDSLTKAGSLQEIKSQFADALNNENDALIMGVNDNINLIYEFKAEFIEKGLTAVYNLISKTLGEPIAYFFGQAPKGENATGEFDFKNHLDNLRKNINLILEPVLVMFQGLGIVENFEIEKVEIIEEQKYTMQDLISLGQNVVMWQESEVINETQKNELMDIIVKKTKQLMGVDFED